MKEHELGEYDAEFKVRLLQGIKMNMEIQLQVIIFFGNHMMRTSPRGDWSDVMVKVAPAQVQKPLSETAGMFTSIQKTAP